MSAANSGFRVFRSVRWRPVICFIFLFAGTQGIAAINCFFPRNAYPINVTAVVWQWGRPAEPAVQTAPLEECTFRILKP